MSWTVLFTKQAQKDARKLAKRSRKTRESEPQRAVLHDAAKPKGALIH